MKKAFLSLIILLTALSAYTQSTHTTSFSINDLSFDIVKAADSNIYTIVKLANHYGHTSEEGKPELPINTIRLIIPFGQVVSNISVANIQTQDYYVKHWVYPADSCGLISSFYTTPDPVIYGSNQAYPCSPVTNWAQDYFDGNNLVSITICPFEYHPSSGLLKMITSMTVSVSCSEENQNQTVPLQRLQHTQNLVDSILYHLVDNPSKIVNYHTRPTIVNELAQTSTGLPVYEYVVVAPRVFASSLQNFVTWKNQKGCRTGIVYIEDILEAYPNGDQIGTYQIKDAAGGLRQYLHDAYLLGTFYALLVGDPNAGTNPNIEI